MAIDPNTLLNEVRCLACNSNASEADMMLLALLQRIAEAGAVAGGAPGGPLNAVQFQSPLGTFAGSSDLTFNDTTNVLALAGSQTIATSANTTALALSGYSLTGANAQSMVSLDGTWNTTGNPVALRLSIVNTASGATAKFLEFLGGAAGATSLVSVDKNGFFTAPIFDTSTVRINANGVQVASTFSIGFTDGAVAGAKDTFMFRDAANVFAQRNTTTAQTFRLYRTFTNSTNYERLALQTAAGQMILAAETQGTGTDNLDLVVTPAGTGLFHVTTAATADAAVVSTHTARVKFNGTEYKVLLATP